MTKLMKWVTVISAFVAVYVALLTNSLPVRLSHSMTEVVALSPLCILMTFACYSLATIGYRVATFNDCEEASKELQQQIKEAKADLKKKGMKLD